MSISITTSDVKRKAMIADTTTDYDSQISALIAEMQAPLEYSLEDSYLSNTADDKLQATLKLGILEIITGEFIEQLLREIGSTEQFTIAGVTIGKSDLSGVELIQQGATRLAPYLKCTLPMMGNTASSSSTTDKDAIFSPVEEVW